MISKFIWKHTSLTGPAYSAALFGTEWFRLAKVESFAMKIICSEVWVCCVIRNFSAALVRVVEWSLPSLLFLLLLGVKRERGNFAKP
jgi:hypothetical protein